MNIDYLIENPNEFNRVSRIYDCEIPKGNCWRVIVKHKKTSKLYEYYEEDCYYSLQDQLDDSPVELKLSLVSE